jgi:uncharacterized protein
VFIGVMRVELRIPASGSLKGKRHVIKAITGGLRAKFNVAVAEVDHQDQWQRASLGVSCVSESSFHAKKQLHEVERFIERNDEIELLDALVDVHSWEDD